MTDETTTEQLAEIEGQPQAEPIQVREGRWRTRGGKVKDVTAMPTDHVDFSPAYPWWDCHTTWSNNGTYSVHENAMDLVEYLGPIEPDKTQELPDKTQELDGKTQELPAEAIEELRSEVSYVQNLLGESRQRVTQLEELVGSLRTINEGAEKAVSGAGVVNDSLRLQLAAVKAEVASVAADRYRLLIELDAARQVPADSPEIRQLRADLEQMTLGRDTYRDGYERVLSDLETARETAKAEAVEAIVEWLEPVQAAIAAADNVAESTRAGWLAEEVIQHLPKIMRNLVGLDSPEEIE